MRDTEELDEREVEIRRRMKESLGALNRAQAELAVDLQEEDDALKAKEKFKAEVANRKAAAEAKAKAEADAKAAANKTDSTGAAQ